jgi:hypothetical protein
MELNPYILIAFNREMLNQGELFDLQCDAKISWIESLNNSMVTMLQSEVHEWAFRVCIAAFYVESAKAAKLTHKDSVLSSLNIKFDEALSNYLIVSGHLKSDYQK